MQAVIGAAFIMESAAGLDVVQASNTYSGI